MTRIYKIAVAGILSATALNLSAAHFGVLPTRNELQINRVKDKRHSDSKGANLTDIITSPEGKLINYNKLSYGTYVLGNQQQLFFETFPAEVTWGKENTVYFKNFISAFPLEYYIKGTINNNVINIPTGQTVFYSEEEEYGVNLGVLKLNIDEDTDEIEFTIAEEIENITIVVEPSGDMYLKLPGKQFNKDDQNTEFPDYVVGLYYTDDLQFTGFCDFSQDYTKLDIELVTIPKDIEILPYSFVDKFNYAYIVDVAFDGDDLYIRGLCDMLPEGTIKAKINGTKATVAQNEYLGVYYDLYHIFTKVLFENPDYDEEDDGSEPYIFAPADTEFELTIDPTTRTIFADKEGVYLSFHCDETDYTNSLGYYDIFELKYQDSYAGTPSNPTEPEYTTEWMPLQGYNDFFFTMSNFSTEGYLLDSNKIYYKVYVNNEPIVFQEQTAENLLGEETIMYPNVPKAVELMPYLFENNYDIFKYPGNVINIGIYYDDVKTIGVQTIYYYENEFTYSDIVTLNVATGEITENPANNITNIEANHPVTIEYYTIDGRRIKNPQKGIYIQVSKDEDGRTTSKKVLM